MKDITEADVKKFVERLNILGERAFQAFLTALIYWIRGFDLILRIAERAAAVKDGLLIVPLFGGILALVVLGPVEAYKAFGKLGLQLALLGLVIVVISFLIALLVRAVDQETAKRLGLRK